MKTSQLKQLIREVISESAPMIGDSRRAEWLADPPANMDAETIEEAYRLGFVSGYHKGFDEGRSHANDEADAKNDQQENGW